MTPEQALQLLDNAASIANGTRKDHDLVKEAVATLSRLIDSSKPKAAPTES